LERLLAPREQAGTESLEAKPARGAATLGGQAMKKHLVRDPSPVARSRREWLGLVGAGAAATLLGSLVAPSARAAPMCVVRPEQTAGPYYVDTRLNRADIRSDPSDGSVKPGVPLQLEFVVSCIDGARCTPLAGAVVDVWQCDAHGVYSGVRDFSGRFDTTGKQFLRGHQLTDADGRARFLTIYPGSYPGRAVHVHFKVRSDPAAGQGAEFTSQLYFDDALTDRVHAEPPYARDGQRRVRNDADGLYRRGGRELMLQLARDAQGYSGRFELGLRMAG
jgi:protocatechuate 3,4-dioxygenase beta subunit